MAFSNNDIDLMFVTGLIAEVIGKLENMTPEEVMAEARRRAAKQRERMMKKHAAFQAAFANVTDKQSLRIAQMESRGYKSGGKIMQDRRSGNVAVLLVNDNIWNGEKGRIGTKLMMVYPDGTSNETFEKKISVRKEF